MNGPVARLVPYLLAFFSSLCIMVLELVASRLVGRHVGGSLTVWTSVIGVILLGICLGNVLGGRLADRVAPGRAIGPLYAVGSAMVLACLATNAVVGMLPGLEALPWDLRTVVVVTLDFLVPATTLGMIGPVVAKMAVERSTRAGTALGLVYFLGAVGSIAGTLLAGYWLIYLAPTSAIVLLVAAAYAALAAALLGGAPAAALGVLAAVVLVLGAVEPSTGSLSVPGIRLGGTKLNALALAGSALGLALAVLGVARLRRDRLPAEDLPAPIEPVMGRRPTLRDLAALSFVASLAFMALEMVAGRLVAHHLGSSIYGWTSVIAVLLGGLSLGNFLGGLAANRITREAQASWLFLAASILTLTILPLETPPTALSKAIPWFYEHTPILSEAIGDGMQGYPWWSRVLLLTTAVFLLPSAAMGTVSPVVAKLAVDRMARYKRSGTAIGQVYAWGMVGSIVGTFLTGFVLIDVVGTKGMLLILGAVMALAATVLGTAWHAAWAGIPLGLCLIAFLPGPWFRNQAVAWGIREPAADPTIEADGIAYLDESKYYHIKIENDPEPDGQKRTLVLDNLIHGYYVFGHPERLDYDYEHIYALVTRRVAEARARAAGIDDPARAPLEALFLGGGSYTFQRYLQHVYPPSAVDVAEIDPAVTRANFIAMGLPRDTPIRTYWGDARQYVARHQGRKYDLIFGDAFNDFSIPWHLTTKEFNDMIAGMLAPGGVFMANIIDVYESDETARAQAEAEEVDPEAAVARARGMGAFLGAWVNTAKQTFNHVHVFGTEAPGGGQRETFVVIASKDPIDLGDLGRREGDPSFTSYGLPTRPILYDDEHMKALAIRSRGIILTDDYAPVENLLAPVAATRGD